MLFEQSQNLFPPRVAKRVVDRSAMLVDQDPKTFIGRNDRRKLVKPDAAER
jgi:hypothetical protein